MGDAATKKAFRDNLNAILEGFGWQRNDLSVDPDIDTINFCSPEYEGSTLEDPHNQRPGRTETRVSIMVKGNRIDRDKAYDMQVEAEEKIKEFVKPDTLNVDTLAISQPITNVKHLPSQADYSTPIARVLCSIDIRFRQT